MCRLFGLHAGGHEVHASYWLVDAPDSVLVESHRNPDGAGIGWCESRGDCHVVKWGRAAYRSAQFERTAQSVTANTVVTHVRAATTGSDSKRNSHPFLIEDRLVAHNGGFGDLPAVERRLGDYLRFVHGDTDSERFAALIAMESDRHGDVTTGITAAAQWLATNVPLYSLNVVVTAPGHLWALRYPDQRALHIASRVVTAKTDDQDSDGGWHGSSAVARHDFTTSGPDSVPIVVLASERIDGSSDWRMLDPCELVHVGPDLQITSTTAVPAAPAHFHLPAGVDHNDDSD